MKYIKPLIDKNLELFRQNIETSLYGKLSEKLDEVKVDVASDLYNEGRCVPCSKQVNESKLEDMDHDDCVEYLMDSKDMSKEEASTECGHIRRRSHLGKKDE